MCLRLRALLIVAAVLSPLMDGPSAGAAQFADDVFVEQLTLKVNGVVEAEEADAPHAGTIALPVDRDLRRQVERLERQIEAGEHADAARRIARLLASDGMDYFLDGSAEGATRTSARAQLQRLLTRLQPEGAAAYELEIGAAARRQLAEAAARQDERALRDIARRYPLTEAAGESLFRLGHLYRDRGRPAEAALCLERLRGQPGFARFEPKLSVLLAICWRESGHDQRAREALVRLKREFPEAAIRIEKNPATPLFAEEEKALDWLAALTSTTAGPNVGREAPGGPPFPAARWYAPIGTDPLVRRNIERKRQAAAAAETPLLPMLRPIAVGELALLRTAAGFRVFALDTGEPLWAYPAEEAAHDAGLENQLWCEAAFAGLASDGRLVFLVENAGPVPDAANAVQASVIVNMWGGGGFGGGFVVAEERVAETSPRWNTLCAREVAPPRQGNLRWQIGGVDGGDEPRLAGAFFLGTPQPSGGRLYVLAEIDRALHLVVLHATAGRVEWMQEIAGVDQPVSNDPFRRMIGASPLIAEGVAVCPTGAGGVIAVDLLSQSLLWACRYPRRLDSRFVPDEGTFPRLHQGQRWADAVVLADESRVVITPPEADDLYCLELQTGRLLWTKPREEHLYLAAISRGKAILVGRKGLTALRTSDGTPAWPHALELPEGALPSGRGVQSGDGYFLPLTTAEILYVDLEAGEVLGRIHSLKETVPGNLVRSGHTYLSQGAEYLEVFDDAAALERSVSSALAAKADDPAALARLGEIRLQKGEFAAAINLFRRSHAADPTPRTRNLLIGALLDGLRNGVPQRDEIAAELDRLSGEP